MGKKHASTSEPHEGARKTEGASKRRFFAGLGMEIVKVVYMFSMAVEVFICAQAAWTGDLSMLGPMLLLLLIPVCSVLARRFVRNFVGFLLLHIALCGVVFLYPDVVSRIMAIGFVAADVLYIYVRRLSGENDVLTSAGLAVAFGVAVVMYFLADRMEAPFVRPVLVTMFIIQAVVYLVYFHQNNVKETLMISGDAVNQSTRKIKSINNKIIVGFVVVMLIVIGAGVLLRMDLVFSTLGHLLFLMIRTVVRFLFRGDAQPETESGVTETPMDTSQPLAFQAEGETFLIWKILEKLLIGATVILAIVAVGYLLYKFYQKFTNGRVEETELADYAETTLFIEKARKVKKERKPLKEYFAITNERKVRRLYRKKVEKQIKAGVPVDQAKTVQEIRRMAKNEDLGAISRLYEKARYSDQPISREEMEDMDG